MNKLIIVSLISVLMSPPLFLHAQTTESLQNISPGVSRQPRVTVSFAPRLGAFQAGSAFDVAIFLDTLGGKVGDISLNIDFDPNKLNILQSVGNKSIITSWTEPPIYSNKTGKLEIKGVVNPGIVVERGLIGIITFKALVPGETRVTITTDSKILAGDNLKTTVKTAFDSGLYTVLVKPQGEVRVFSPTHPLETQWYKNNDPIFSWETRPGVDAFSYVFDNQPFTIPDNDSEGYHTSVSFPDVSEGLSYFHIKARGDGVWGASTHFLVKIDRTPPTNLETEVETLVASFFASRAFVSFSARDTLSGIDHYEVGIIDKKNAPDVSPLFLETLSPYQLPTVISGDVLVLVKAFDKAGNISEAFIDITVFPSFIDFVQHNYLIIILATILFIILGIFIEHYFLGHKVLLTVEETLKSKKAEIDRDKAKTDSQ